MLSRREFLGRLGIGALATGCAGSRKPRAARPNVLMISVDDLNDWIGVLAGHPQALTPNIDALAREGVLFERAYAPTPVCSPTRSSLVTGSYAIRIGAHDHRSSRTPG